MKAFTQNNVAQILLKKEMRVTVRILKPLSPLLHSSLVLEWITEMATGAGSSECVPSNEDHAVSPIVEEQKASCLPGDGKERCGGGGRKGCRQSRKENRRRPSRHVQDCEKDHSTCS